MANEFKVKNGIKFPDNTIQMTAATAGGSVSVGTTPPGSPTAGSLWWDSTYGNLKIYYNDGDTSQWVDASSFSPTSGGAVGTVTSVDMTVPTGLSISGNPITTSGTLDLVFDAGYSIPTTTSQTNWDSAYTQRLQWDGSNTNLVAATGRTSLGASTIGGNLFTLTNPSVVSFPRFNADNTVSALDAATFRTAIGAGTSSTVGTVTSVGGTGTVAGLSLSGTVTSSGNLTLSGTLSTPVSTINDSTTVGQNLVKLTNPSAITFLRVNANNTVSTLDAATFRTAIGAGDMLLDTYDTNQDGIVNHADLADTAPWSGISNKPSTFPPDAHTQAISTITGLQTALDGKEAGGTAASLVTSHEALVDPHPQYATLPEVAGVTGDMIGFIDRTSTTLSFVEATRTFTITPTGSTWSVYNLGSLVTVTGARSIVIPNTTGSHFVKLNPSTLVLESYIGVPQFATDIIMVYIYWNATTGKAVIVGDERHTSKRDTTWHSNQHLNVGTVWRSGGALGYTLNAPATVTLSLASPILIADEDLLHTITHAASPDGVNYQQILTTAASLEVIYLSGTDYTRNTASTSPWIAGTTTASYNSISGASGSLVDAGEGKYITYWVLATNDMRSPVKLVLGRQSHSTLDAAYAESFEEYGMSFAEQVFMYQVVVQTSTSFANTAKVQIVGVRKLLDRLASAASSYSAGAHGDLTGREAIDQHPISAITGLQTALDGKQASGSYAPTTSGTSILYGNGSGGFSNATIGDKLSFSAGTLDYAGPRITVGTSAPSSPALGDLWVDTN